MERAHRRGAPVFPPPLDDDDELARRLGASQRQRSIGRATGSNRQVRSIAIVGPEGKIVNRLLDAGMPALPTKAVQPPTLRSTEVARTGLITEDEVKSAVKSHLERDGWTVRVTWGRERGIDIQDARGSEVLIIEAKGEAANPPQQVNYFLGALGE